jgi:hypothetical protein
MERRFAQIHMYGPGRERSSATECLTMTQSPNNSFKPTPLRGAA